MTDETALEQLLSQWERASADGREMSASDLCRDRPDLVPALERRMQAIRQMDQLAGAGASASNTPTVDSGATGRPGKEATDYQATLGGGPGVGAASAIPGYDILRVLGRGGMGVVYQARHRKLNRLVALKMILAGGHARAAEQQRFIAEAEAVAHLQHHNIVQIFESGQHQGLPYFTLEYVPGGSLADKVREAPLPPREAARVVEQMAQGMAYAHQRGVVHRDLKPDNVLLDNDGTPKITDFGLAKRVAEPGMTQTGAVMGTPSYMAPEQAAGKTKAIGPLTDVYGLGAVLYRLVTGRPPFQGATTLETMLQVTETEPVRPTQLQPKLPRDLETIVLKCLQKDPAKRYKGAAALAEDLRRFQAGEPILARRVGALERGWRWCRRKPALAITSAASLLLLAGILVLMLGSLVGMTGLYLSAENQRDLADKQRLQAVTERKRADEERRVAEGERQRADDQRKQAEIAAENAQRRKVEAEAQRQIARDQADRAQQVSLFLAGLFEASDPLGLNGFAVGLMSKTGEQLTAKELLDRGAQRIAANVKLAPHIRADILDTVGNVSRSLGEHQQAERMLQMAMNLRKETNAPASEMAASLHALAWLRHEQGQYPLALQMYREALELRLAAPEPDPVAIANTQLNLGWVLTETEQYDDAEILFKDVLARRLKHFGAEHRETLMAKMALAAFYLDTNRFLVAGPLASEAIAGFKKLGEDQNIIAAALKFQEGVIAHMFGDNRGAEAKLRHALTLARESLPPKHLYLTLPLVQLGMVSEVLKNDEQAEQFYVEALDICGERVGMAHPKVLIIARGLAHVKHRRGQDPYVEEMYQGILRAHQKRFGDRDPFVADVRVELAEHFAATSQTKRQDEELQEAAAIYRTPAGLGRRRACSCFTTLGHLRYRAKRFAEGEPYYRSALEAARRRNGGKPVADVAYALENIADALIKQGKYTAEVDKLLTEAEQILPALPAAERGDPQFFVVVSRCNYWRGKEGKFAEPAALLRQAAKTMPRDGWRFRDFGFQMALCHELAQKATNLDDAERTKLCDELGAQAVGWLRQAWQPGGVNAIAWEKEAALVSLRQRDDFRKLMAEVKK